MSVTGIPAFGLSTESPITAGGRATDDDGYLALSRSTRDILVPTYSNEVLLNAANPPPLVHLPTFDAMRSAITYARQLIFALHAPHGTFGNAQNRITLTGDARSFDYTLAHYMYETRDVSGDFGVLAKGHPKFSAEQIAAVAENPVVMARCKEAGQRLEKIELLWQKSVVHVLAAAVAAQEPGASGDHGGGFFGRRKSSLTSLGLNLGKGKVNYQSLAKVAGPLVLEAKEVHLWLEVCVMEVMRRQERGI
jgi:hypothetical protein